MKILFAIQGTGNGHLSRAKEVIPILQQYGELDILVSGTQADVKLKQAIKYQMHGLSFVFGKKGGVNCYQTWCSMNLSKFRKDMKVVPLKDYNLIINDFEPITAWACKTQKIESVSLSHQASFISKKVPRPQINDFGKYILNYYAPTTQHVGFHFDRYDDFINTPVIRSEIRNLITSNLGHYTVYLPAFDDQYLVKLLKKLPQVKWQVFAKNIKLSYIDENVEVKLVNNENFNLSLASCEGLLTGGGFEGPAEALFLNKKLLVVPMKNQYEQLCNAYALHLLGLPVIWPKEQNWLSTLKHFINYPQSHAFNFPDQTAKIIDQVVKSFAR